MRSNGEGGRGFARFGWALVLGALLGSAPAAAQPVYGRKDPLLPLRLDAHVSMSWRGDLGIGARADIPLVTNFRYAPRDELALTLGADVTFIALDGTQVTAGYPTVALQWSLGVSERFMFVPELGVTTRIERGSWDGILAQLGFGARYYLYRSVALIGRLGWPLALTAGTTF